MMVGEGGDETDHDDPYRSERDALMSAIDSSMISVVSL